jgi:hypothetical protein
MSARVNEIRRNTHGVPGLRLNERRGQLVVDVAWYEWTPCRFRSWRRATSFLVGTAGPVAAVARAMDLRAAVVGAEYEMTPRQAWNRLRAWRERAA